MILSAPELVRSGVVTLVENVGLFEMVILLHEPPAPRVMTSPPPLRFPAPAEQVIVVSPSTDVPALLP